MNFGSTPGPGRKGGAGSNQYGRRGPAQPPAATGRAGPGLLSQAQIDLNRVALTRVLEQMDPDLRKVAVPLLTDNATDEEPKLLATAVGIKMVTGGFDQWDLPTSCSLCGSDDLEPYADGFMEDEDTVCVQVRCGSCGGSYAGHGKRRQPR
jgi:hypothetical protein